MVDTNSFMFQIGLLMGLSVILGYLFQKIKIPLVTAYILAGLILGPLTNLINPNSELIQLMAEIGLLLISFEIGATMHLSFLRKEALTVGFIAAIELIAVITIGYLVGLLFNFPWIFTMLLIMFSVNTSTSIAFKLIEETGIRREYEERDLKLLFGLATFEDIIAIIGISIFVSIIIAQKVDFLRILVNFYHLVLIFIFLIGFGLIFFKRILDEFYKHGEEFALFAGVGLALIFAWLGSSIGFSPVLGAFIGGLVFSESKMAEKFLERAKWVREIFAFMLFASIGLILPVHVDFNTVLFGIAISLLIVMMKFFAFTFSVWIVSGVLEKALKFSLYMVAISEFAVIITIIALRNGAVGPEMLVIAIFVMIFSSILASILTAYKETVTNKLISFVPQSFKNYLEGYLFKVISQAFIKNGERFLLIRESLIDALLIISFSFVISSFSIFLTNILITIDIPFKIIIISVVIGIVASVYLILSLFLYNIFRNLIINVFKISRRPISISERIPILSLSIMIVLFIALLTFFQIYSNVYSAIRGILGDILNITVIILVAITIVISIRFIYKLFLLFQREIKGK